MQAATEAERIESELKIRNIQEWVKQFTNAFPILHATALTAPSFSKPANAGLFFTPTLEKPRPPDAISLAACPGSPSVPESWHDNLRLLMRAAQSRWPLIPESDGSLYAYATYLLGIEARSPDAPARLAAALPEARLVVQLRNPVDRAYSDYKMLFRRGTVTKGPDHYLDGRPNDQPRFLEDGLYAQHLRRWLAHFDAEQIKILLFEDVKAAPEASVAIVSDHIGAPRHYSTQVGSDPRNDSSERFLPLPVRTALAPLKEAVRPLRGKAMFERVRGVFARQIAYPPLPAALRQRMVDYYARDIADLEELIGRDLSHWRQDRKLAA